MTCLGVSTETDTGIQVTASESPPHPRPYCRGRVWRSFDTDLESRIFEAPFGSLVITNLRREFFEALLDNMSDKVVPVGIFA